MNDTAIVKLSAVVLFAVTVLFSYAYKIISPLMKGYTYIKCLTGGFIIGIILMEVLPDIYKTGENLPIIVTGLSFFLLFAISKMYIERVEAKEQDSIPEGAGKREALIFILALSLHSFMEGLGISSKKGTQLMLYITSILVHKWLEAIVLGASVLTSSLSRAACFYLILIYSSLTSIGALLGHWIASTDPHNTLTLTLNGIAAGSFFYIGFVEMVGNEFETSSGKLTRRKALKKILSMFIGFSFITLTLSIAHSIEGHP